MTWKAFKKFINGTSDVVEVTGEVKTLYIEVPCNVHKCDGHMVYNPGTNKDDNVRCYRHECDKCGNEHFYNKRYPCEKQKPEKYKINWYHKDVTTYDDSGGCSYTGGFDAPLGHECNCI